MPVGFGGGGSSGGGGGGGGTTQLVVGTEVNASIHQTSAQTLTTGTDTVLTLTAVAYDTDGCAQSSFLRINTPGVYILTGLVEFAANATGVRRLTIRGKTTGVIYAVQERAAAASGTTIMVVTAQVNAALNDDYELVGHQTSGGNLDTVVLTGVRPSLRLSRVGPTPQGGGTLPAARVFHSVNVSLSDAAWTTLAFDSEISDSNGLHDLVTNNSRLTCTQTGEYDVSARLVFASNATGNRGARIIKNGDTAKIFGVAMLAATEGGGYVTVDVTMGLVAGDFVEVQGFQSSGGGLNVLGGATEATQSQFAMQRVGITLASDHNHTTADGTGPLTADEHDTFSEYLEVAAPSTPAAGKVRMYAKADGNIYKKDDTGAESQMGGGGGGAHDLISASHTASGLQAGDAVVATAATTFAFVPQFRTIPMLVGNGESALTTGIKARLIVDFACVIVSATLLTDQTGSAVIDILKSTYANFPTTASICASAKPTVSSARKSQDTTLTGWTTAVAAGDVLEYEVESASVVTQVLVSLKVRVT